MNRSRSRHGDANESNMNTQILERLDEIIEGQGRLEQMIAGSQRFAYAVAKSELRRDLKEMAKFDTINADVSKLTDLTQSIKTAFDANTAERDRLQAELDALKAADSVDQEAVDAVDVKLAAANAVLDTLTAVATNTPAEPSLGGT